MENQNLEEFSKTLGVKFNDINNLKSALTHRSYINETDNGELQHNERVEFLGDAVLELIVSEYLYHKYPDRPEGELTSFRAATVKTESLAEASRRMGVGDYLYMSKGEEATGGRDKDYLLANAFEAILGAIYVDQGYDECEKFVKKWLTPKVARIVRLRLDVDAKTKFQEVAQRLLRETPEYRLVQEVGPDHEKEFTMEVVVGVKVFGRGKGSSKQRAEEEAAKKGLEKIQRIHKSSTIA